MTKTPSCATPEQYESWLILAAVTSNARFCADCTPGHQARMKIEGRCDRPEIKFDDEGGIVQRTWHGK